MLKAQTFHKIFPYLLLIILLPIVGSASTISIISGNSTVDGRPLLAKNRDNSANPDQEFYFNTTGPLVYISVSYAGVEDQAWGGANETGFAIVNADAWNFPDFIPGPDDDGDIQDLALRTCVTVEDFQAIMDSTDASGRTLPTMYACIDAQGNGAIFECEPDIHYRFNLNDPQAAPNGYMVRANFAYEGGPYHLGQHRHDRYLALLDSAYAGGFISHDFVSMTIQQDIVNEETDPYPLPYQGREGVMPYGLLHTHDALNRDITRSGCVIQGIMPGENPSLTTIWAIVGEPITTITMPLWVHAGSTPPEFDGPDLAPLNVKAQEFRDYLYLTDLASDAIDTWRLVDDRGLGFQTFLNGLEQEIVAAGDSALALWRTLGMPPSQEVEDFQNDLAAYAYLHMDAWGPPQVPQVTFEWQTPDQVLLDWNEIIEDVFNRPITVSAYTVYTADSPFYERFTGDSLTTVTAPPVLLPVSEDMLFFQVRCQP
jgi:hypothetical protein